MVRRPEIDRLKGLAILGVLLIHARPLAGTLAGDHLVNRAVPVFLVLFGVTSELWWRARSGGECRGAGERDARETRGAGRSRPGTPLGRAGGRSPLSAWYRGRAARLLVPLWATLAVWWTLVIALGAEVPVAPRFVAATALGYLPWLGTGWFVTVVLQLVVLFPALHWGVRRLGAAAALALGAAALLASYAFMFEITALMRRLLLDSGPRDGLEAFYYFWIFVPARLFAVIAGVVLARAAPPAEATAAFVGRGLVAGAAAALALGWLGALPRLADPRAVEAVAALLDVPLTIVLLAAVRPLPSGSVAARALAWCGRSSWGLYLGQMLIHDGLHAFGIEFEEGAAAACWAYGAGLLAGAVSLVHAGERLRRTLVPGRAPDPAAARGV